MANRTSVFPFLCAVLWLLFWCSPATAGKPKPPHQALEHLLQELGHPEPVLLDDDHRDEYQSDDSDEDEDDLPAPQQEPAPVQPRIVYIVSSVSPVTIRQRGGFFPTENSPGFALAWSDPGFARHYGVEDESATNYEYELAATELSFQGRSNDRLLSRAFPSVQVYRFDQIRRIRILGDRSGRTYRGTYNPRYDESQPSLRPSWLIGNDEGDEAAQTRFISSRPRPVGWRGQLPLVRSPDTVGEAQQLLNASDADLDQITRLCEDVRHTAASFVMFSEGQVPRAATAIPRAQLAEEQATTVAQLMERITQRSNEHSFLGAYFYDMARQQVNGTDPLMPTLDESMSAIREGLATLFQRDPNPDHISTVDGLHRESQNRVEQMARRITELQEAIRQEGPESLRPGASDTGASDNGAAVSTLWLHGWETRLGAMRRDLAELQRRQPMENRAISLLEEVRERLLPAVVQLSLDETRGLGIDWERATPEMRQMQQRLIEGNLDQAQCAAVRTALIGLWLSLSLAPSRGKRDTQAGPARDRGNANAGQPSSAPQACWKLNHTIEQIRESPSCKKLRSLRATLRMGNDYGAGTWDFLSVAVESEYQHEHRDVETHLLEPLRDQNDNLARGDIGVAQVRSGPVALTDIGYVGLYDLSFGGTLSEDAWEMEAFYLVGQCFDSPRLVMYEYKPKNPSEAWFQHSGKDVIIHDESRRKRKAEKNRVWYRNITLTEWKQTVGLPKQ